MDAIAHGQLDNFTLEQLGLFITLLLGGVGGLLAIIFKSRCKKVKCCCIECDRDVILPTLTGESDILNRTSTRHHYLLLNIIFIFSQLSVVF